MVSAPLKKTCVVCSSPIVGGGLKYCGPVCFAAGKLDRKRRDRKAGKYREQQRRYNSEYRKRPEVVIARRAESKIRKHYNRAFVRGAAAEKIDPLEIFERDGWLCGLCGCKTPKGKRGTYDANAPELDHIVPIAAGGAHVRSNVQCACRACNMAKGKKPLGQLRMVG